MCIRDRVDTPEQRRLRVNDSVELAWNDWLATAAFDREEDHWPRQWAKAYVDFSAGDMYAWLCDQGMRFFPVVGWAERGEGHGKGQGNSVPRFHIAWGTGHGVIEPFLRRVQEHVGKGRIKLYFRHRVTSLVTSNGAVSGVTGELLASDGVERGKPSNRNVEGRFEFSAPQAIVCAGGIGACLLYTSPSPRDRQKSRMPSSA